MPPAPSISCSRHERMQASVTQMSDGGLHEGRATVAKVCVCVSVEREDGDRRGDKRLLREDGR